MDASPPSGRNLLRLHHLKRQLCFQIVGESVETAFSRCASSPDDREAVTQRMTETFGGCRSVRTSGTLRGLRDRYPPLRVPQKRRR